MEKPVDTTSRPLLIIADFCRDGSKPADSGARLNLKALTASVLRSRCGFQIAVFHAGPEELFRISRREVEEIGISQSGKATPDGMAPLLDTVIAFAENLSPDGPEWILVADTAGLALRDPSHLLPEEIASQYPAALFDFYWTPCGNDSTRPSAGLWAVRRQYLTKVLTGWRRYRNEFTAKAQTSHKAVSPVGADLWVDFVHQLPLKKKRFEAGEVTAPAVKSLDWSAVRQSCWVTIPNWPAEEQWTFLQSLYLGTWFGDRTGFMLDLLDA